MYINNNVVLIIDRIRNNFSADHSWVIKYKIILLLLIDYVR